jgi:hypothetical protein
MHLNTVEFCVGGEDLQEFDPVAVIAENSPLFIPAAGYVIPGTWVFYAKRSVYTVIIAG